MKQTNNAIKFLVAQYRAIFKAAYFKGLVTAVALTAGLGVAAQANAANDKVTHETLGLVTSDAPYLNIDGIGEGTGAPSANNSGSEYQFIQIDSKTNAVKVQNFEGIINITGGSADDAGNRIKADQAKAVTISGTGTLLINGNGAGLLVSGGNSAGGDVLINLGTVDVIQGTLQIEGISAQGKATVTAKNINIGQDSGASGTVILDKINSSLGTAADANNSGSTINLKKTGTIKFGNATGTGSGNLNGKLVATGGTLNFVGNAGGIVNAYGQGNDLNVTVNSGGVATIKIESEDNIKTTDVDESLLEITSGQINIATHV